MITRFKNWLRHRDTVRVEAAVLAELDEMFVKAQSMRKYASGQEKWRDIEDFMTASEARKYSEYALAHFYLCEALGKTSTHFKKHKAMAHEDNSPIATLTVKYDQSTKHDFFEGLPEESRESHIKAFTKDEEFEERFLEYKRARRHSDERPWWDYPMGYLRDKAYAEHKAKKVENDRD